MMSTQTEPSKNEIPVLLLENIHPSASETFHAYADGRTYAITRKSSALKEDDLIAALGGMQLLGIRSKTRVTKRVLENAPSLLALGCFCIGTNQVDLVTANACGIPVFNAPFSNTRSVAELMIGEIITLARQLGDRSSEVHKGVWKKVAASCYEVRGKTLGIVGYGHIGRQLGVLAESLGMRVIYFDIAPRLPMGNNRSVPSLNALLAEADFVCPVDGAISQFGRIERDQIFQAKGHRYSTAALLGGDSERAAAFVDGDFATLYLSPRDYHRIHMPVGGRLRQMLHVPGELFSVNPATARGVAGLFARNERVVCLFDADFGPFVLTLVGATIVGSMATVWHGTVNPPRSGEIRSWTYDDRRIELAKGEEMGRFMLGSTVVMLFPRNTLAFNPDWRAARPVRMGEMMAKRTPSGA